MIIDSHCHAWPYWPYEPPIPDPETRGNAAQLVHQLDINSVDRAVVICAQINHNANNNEYVYEQMQNYAPRLIQFADIDSEWSATYHQPGAADRLRAAANRYQLKGFTHYLKNDDNGAWLYSDEGNRFFEVAADQTLIASISCRPHHHAALRRVAERFPSVPILVHHLGLVTHAGDYGTLKDVLESAAYDNIYIKVSGFAYNARIKWDFPYRDVQWLVRAEYAYFGAERMVWGSDFPVVSFFMTYQQALEAFRTHCDFVPPADRDMMLGGTIKRLLER